MNLLLWILKNLLFTNFVLTSQLGEVLLNIDDYEGELLLNLLELFDEEQLFLLNWDLYFPQMESSFKALIISDSSLFFETKGIGDYSWKLNRREGGKS